MAMHKEKDSDKTKAIREFIKAAVRKEVGIVKPEFKKHIEVVIVYEKQDYRDVLDFRNDLLKIVGQSEFLRDLRILLFDDEVHFLQSKVKIVDEMVRKCCLLMFYLTKNSDTSYFKYVCEETLAKVTLDRSSYSERFETQANIIVPVHTLPKHVRNYQTPPGMSSLHALDWFDRHSTFTIDKVKGLLTNARKMRGRQETEDNASREFAFVHHHLKPMAEKSAMKSSEGQYKVDLSSTAEEKGTDRTKSGKRKDKINDEKDNRDSEHVQTVFLGLTDSGMPFTTEESQEVE